MAEHAARSWMLALAATALAAVACNGILGNADGNFVADSIDGGGTGFSDGGTSVDGAVTPGTGFCGTAGISYFCDDFDEGLGTSRWSSADASPGSTAMVSTAFASSAPNALQAIAAAPDGGSAAAGVSLQLPLSSLKQLDFDVHVERSPGTPNATAALAVLTFRDASRVVTGSISILDGAGEQVSAFVQQGTSGTSLTTGLGPLTHAGFSHVRVEVNLQPPDSASITVSLLSGGATYPGLETVFVGPNAEIAIGAQAYSGTYETYVDNVIIHDK